MEEVIKRKDGEKRGAKVRRAGKGKHESIKRPVQKLTPLEIANKVGLLCENGVEMQTGKGDKRQKEDGKEEKEGEEKCTRPSRIAAQNSRAKTRLMLDL